MTRCPECGGPVLIWADNSGGATINFRCEAVICKSGKGPWDTEPPADIEFRSGKWLVRYRKRAIVGSYTAKYKAREQANELNGATGY